jgi:type VI secretion system secreted protein VgrG
MTIKSQTHKGDGFNELRFEDELDRQEVFIHAQKDQNTQVNNNQTLAVGVDRTQKIGQDETIAVGRNRLRAVKANDTLKVGGGKNDLIAGDYEVEAGNTIRLKCGKTLIEMHANGTLNITCETFNLTGQQSGQINTPAAKLDLNPEGGQAGATANGRASGGLKADVDGHFE